jgi:hypothetical protein
VISFVSDAGFGSDERRRTLKNIAAFSEERAKRSTFKQTRKKQSDADEIKRWEKELKMSYERFIVTTTLFMSCVYDLMLNSDACSIGYRHSHR